MYHLDQIKCSMDIGCVIRFTMDVWWILLDLVDYEKSHLNEGVVELIMRVGKPMETFLVCVQREILNIE